MNTTHPFSPRAAGRAAITLPPPRVVAVVRFGYRPDRRFPATSLSFLGVAGTVT
jgi:hypothetical protein